MKKQLKYLLIPKLSLVEIDNQYDKHTVVPFQ